MMILINSNKTHTMMLRGSYEETAPVEFSLNKSRCIL